MVNIVTNGSNPSSVTLNVDTGEVSPVFNLDDSLVRLADDAGMVEAINDINLEGRQTDRELRDERQIGDEAIYSQDDDQEQDDYYEPIQQFQEDQNDGYNDHPQERPRKKVTRKSKGDKRYNDLIGKLSEKAQENEELARQRDDTARELKLLRDEQTAMLLNIEKQKIADDINRVTDVMIRAKETDQTRIYVESNRVMNDLVQKEAQMNNAINTFNELQDQQNYEAPVSEYEELAEQLFYDLSDSKELNSPAYTEWLKENPHCNPYDKENFDGDLSQDIHSIKKEFNKFLKYNRNGSFIGTPEYYSEVDALVNQKLYGGFSQQPAQYSNYGYNKREENREMTSRYNIPINPGYEEIYGQPMQEGQSRMRGTYPDDPGYQAPREAYRPQQGQQQQQGQRGSNVMPVSRNGYNQNYSGGLPELDERERKLAITFPMYDTQGRALSDREKLQEYASQKATLMNKNRR